MSDQRCPNCGEPVNPDAFLTTTKCRGCGDIILVVRDSETGNFRIVTLRPTGNPPTLATGSPVPYVVGSQFASQVSGSKVLGGVALCKKCGAPLWLGGRYCSVCGFDQENPSPPGT